MLKVFFNPLSTSPSTALQSGGKIMTEPVNNIRAVHVCRLTRRSMLQPGDPEAPGPPEASTEPRARNDQPAWSYLQMASQGTGDLVVLPDGSLSRASLEASPTALTDR